MKQKLHLYDLKDDSLDAILALPEDNKLSYFCSLVETFFPEVSTGSEEYVDLLESYYSSFYTEKLYRSNNFLREKFTAIYTDRGLIRNLVNNLYYLDEDLVVH